MPVLTSPPSCFPPPHSIFPGTADEQDIILFIMGESGFQLRSFYETSPFGNHTDIIKLSSSGNGGLYSQYKLNSEETAEVLPILNITGNSCTKVQETAILLPFPPQSLKQYCLKHTVFHYLMYKLYLTLLLQMIKKVGMTEQENSMKIIIDHCIEWN